MIKNKIIIKILSFIMIMGCGAKKIDYSIIKIGTYPYTTKQIKDDKILPLINKIEKNIDYFDDIVRHFYSDEEREIKFTYTYTSSHNDKIILRYFAPIHSDKLYAGYSLQFVVEKNKIKEIYLFKVPLE